MEMAAQSLGEKPESHTQRQVARFFESLSYMLPDKDLCEKYAEVLKKNSVYRRLRNTESCAGWVKEVIAEVPLKTQPVKFPGVTPTMGMLNQMPFPFPRFNPASEPAPVLRNTTSTDGSWKTSPAPAPPAVLPAFQKMQIRVTRFAPRADSLNTGGTPARYRRGANVKHTRALQRLEQSARTYKGKVAQ